MAIRTKTISYHIQSINYSDTTYPALTSTFTYELSSSFIAIPETVVSFSACTVTLDSVWAPYLAASHYISTQTVSTWLNRTSSIGTADYIVNSATGLQGDGSASFTFTGRHNSAKLVVDVTPAFVARFTGSNGTIIVRHNAVTSAPISLQWANRSAELNITYQYDDSAATQIKTVYIPMSTPSGSLPLSGVFTNIFPALDTYLPEIDKVYRDCYFTMRGNTANSALSASGGGLTYGTDFIPSYSGGIWKILPGAAVTTLWSDVDITLRGSHFDPWTGLMLADTSVTHSQTVAHFTGNPAAIPHLHHSQLWLTCTYEYNESSSTTIMNSLRLASNNTDTSSEISAVAGNHYGADYLGNNVCKFNIEEPGPIVPMSSSLQLQWTQRDPIAAGNTGIQFRPATTEPWTNINSTTDSPGSSTTGYSTAQAMFLPTLTRGANTLNCQILNSTGSLSTLCNMKPGAVWIINYKSSKSTQGSGAHNHTIVVNPIGPGPKFIAATNGAYRTFEGMPISSSYYNNNMFGVYMYKCAGASVTSMPMPNILFHSTSSIDSTTEWKYFSTGESIGIYESATNTYPIGVHPVILNNSALFKRFTGDLDVSRIDATKPRLISTTLNGVNSGFTPLMFYYGLNLYNTYHHITFSVTGSVAGSSGGLVTLNLHKTSNGEKLATTSRTGNGSYAFTWYDNTEKVYVVARESGVLLGRSDDDYAV